MLRTILYFIIILLFTSCSQIEDPSDYFGQPYPDSVPTIFAPGVISLEGRLEQGISFSPDNRELVFGTLGKKNLRGEIFYSKKDNEIWSEPEIFTPLKNISVYLPYFSPNGKSILFSSPDIDDGENTNIWIIEKHKDLWVNPKILNSIINSNYREANASMTNDGVIYFSSNRNCNGKANCHTADLFCSKMVDKDYKSANVITEFLSANDEESVFISPNEDYIIFCRYSNDLTAVDLYISYRDVKNIWITPTLIDSTINSKDWDRRPFVSFDNKYLFFTRLRIEENELLESNIYWVNTSKLFKPFVFNSVQDLSVRIGKKFKIAIPKDYFKDINDQKLLYKVELNDNRWLSFERENMTLSGVPPAEGIYELIITATDKNSNSTEDKIIITVNK